DCRQGRLHPADRQAQAAAHPHPVGTRGANVNEPPLAELSPALACRLDAACSGFESGWQDGGRPRFDDFLAGAGDELYAVLLGELVLLDVYYRRQAGEQPTAADYQTRFPALD